jgi:soluble lytic murein transglycosylase-like protein
MIDMSSLDFQYNKQLSEKQKSRKSTSQATENLPDNCLTWNVHQLNRKALAFKEPIQKYARQYRVDHNLIKSVITAESCFKTKALSHANARGLMQLIPDTAERFGVKDSYDPEQNIHGGVKYLRFLLDRFKGDLKKVIAAYNAGEGKVDRYNGIPPYKETQQYVKNVLATYDKLRAPALKIKKAASAKIKKIATASRKKQTAVSRIRQKIKKKPVVYRPPRLSGKPGRGGWQYNRLRAPHLFKH